MTNNEINSVAANPNLNVENLAKYCVEAMNKRIADQLDIPNLKAITKNSERTYDEKTQY